ncbi:MAG: precorrin-6A/cobalt-precorrin-6A reductase [Parabacteroides merdae]
MRNCVFTGSRRALLVPYPEPEESLSLARTGRIPQKERIIFFHEGEDEKKLLDQLHPDAVLTKESGESGYFKEKVEAAQACGIPVYVIQRPPLPDSFTFVQGMEGLRKAIRTPRSRLLPAPERFHDQHMCYGCRQSRLSRPPEPNGTNR